MALVTDMWFHSASTLLKATEALGLSGPDHDSEDYWEWVNGELCGLTLSITRAHMQSRKDAFVRVFRVDNGAFAPDLMNLVTERLRPLALGSIKCGRWIYRSGHHFDLIVIEERP